MITLLTNLNTVVSKYLSKLRYIQPGGKAYDDAMREGADTALSTSRARIHERGQASDNSAIGQYSSAPMYVSTARVPSIGDPTGKTGKSVFASGRAHRSKYFAGGYNEFKTAIGLNEAGSVNLTLSGEMRDSYQVMKTADGYGLGWDDEEISKRADMLEQKYGKKIWMLTEEERNEFIAAVNEKLDLR